MRLFHAVLGLSAVLAGCANPSGAAPRAVIDLPAHPADVAAPAFTLAGPPSTAAIRVRLHLPYRPLAKTVAADLQSLTFALVTQPIGASPAGATGLTPVGGMFSCNTRAATGSLAFGNVPANADGETYHVVVAAFDDIAGTGNNITNITGTDADSGRVRLAGIDGPFYVSTATVRVSPVSNALSTTAPLDVGVKLQD